MLTILASWTDIADDEYTDFLDMALDWFGFFSLVRRDSRSFDDSAVQIRRDLDIYLFRYGLFLGRARRFKNSRRLENI
jgi:hypothetical protein